MILSEVSSVLQANQILSKFLSLAQFSIQAIWCCMLIFELTNRLDMNVNAKFRFYYFIHFMKNILWFFFSTSFTGIDLTEFPLHKDLNKHKAAIVQIHIYLRRCVQGWQNEQSKQTNIEMERVRAPQQYMFYMVHTPQLNVIPALIYLIS